MPSDLEIAQQARMQPIDEVGATLGIPATALEAFGRYKAKLSLDYLRALADRPNGKLILVSAMSPTPAGEGKPPPRSALAMYSMPSVIAR